MFYCYVVRNEQLQSSEDAVLQIDCSKFNLLPIICVQFQKEMLIINSINIIKIKLISNTQKHKQI